MNLFFSRHAFHVLTVLFAVLLGSATVLQAQSMGSPNLTFYSPRRRFNGQGY